MSLIASVVGDMFVNYELSSHRSGSQNMSYTKESIRPATRYLKFFLLNVFEFANYKHAMVPIVKLRKSGLCIIDNMVRNK